MMFLTVGIHALRLIGGLFGYCLGEQFDFIEVPLLFIAPEVGRERTVHPEICQQEYQCRSTELKDAFFCKHRIIPLGLHTLQGLLAGW